MSAQAEVAAVDWRPIAARYHRWTGIEAEIEDERKIARQQRCIALAELRNLGLTYDQLAELFGDGKSREWARQMVEAAEG